MRPRIDKETKTIIPEDWVVDVSQEWKAWAHSKNYEQGVMEMGATREEAIERLQKRMKDWFSNQTVTSWRAESRFLHATGDDEPII